MLVVALIMDAWARHVVDLGCAASVFVDDRLLWAARHEAFAALTAAWSFTQTFDAAFGGELNLAKCRLFATTTGNVVHLRRIVGLSGTTTITFLHTPLPLTDRDDALGLPYHRSTAYAI